MEIPPGYCLCGNHPDYCDCEEREHAFRQKAHRKRECFFCHKKIIGEIYTSSDWEMPLCEACAVEEYRKKRMWIDWYRGLGDFIRRLIPVNYLMRIKGYTGYGTREERGHG